MTTPGDESRTELAWREIVEHYGERPVLPTTTRPDRRAAAAAAPTPGGGRSDAEAGLPDDLVDDDEVEIRDRASQRPSASVRRPRRRSPTPRTWQRGVAWAGIFVAPRWRW